MKKIHNLRWKAILRFRRAYLQNCTFNMGKNGSLVFKDLRTAFYAVRKKIQA